MDDGDGCNAKTAAESKTERVVKMIVSAFIVLMLYLTELERSGFSITLFEDI